METRDVTCSQAERSAASRGDQSKVLFENCGCEHPGSSHRSEFICRLSKHLEFTHTPPEGANGAHPPDSSLMARPFRLPQPDGADLPRHHLMSCRPASAPRQPSFRWWLDHLSHQAFRERAPHCARMRPLARSCPCATTGSTRSLTHECDTNRPIRAEAIASIMCGPSRWQQIER